ncbi:MAG TPA: aromatic hydrocarbon degradation protein, partial [Ginsengibacter sp.]|nr:aromatic hydrocarbon degradation protein [Ginsengibacter sp.]
QSSRDLNDGYMLRSRYNFSNPLRAILGGTYFLGIGPDLSQQKGFITADVEYVNYAQAGFHDAQGSQDYKDYYKQLKEVIKSQYGSSVNLRLGGELKFNTFMVRLGGAYYGDPYLNEDAHTLRLTGGIGYRNKGFFIDLSYSHASQKDVAYPYLLQDKPNHAAVLDNTGEYIGITFGFKYF